MVLKLVACEIFQLFSFCLGCKVKDEVLSKECYLLTLGLGMWANFLQDDGYSSDVGLGVRIIGSFELVYTLFSAIYPKRSANDFHVPVCSQSIF